MSRKSKGVGLDSTLSYGVGVYDDAKARLKHETLMQDYQELQREVNVMRSRIEAGEQRRKTLAAEVRFLRRRYEYFMQTKTMNSSKKGKSVQAPNFLKQIKHVKKLGGKEANQHMLPPIPEAKPKKKRYVSKEVAPVGTSPVCQQYRKMLHGGREATQHRLTQFSDLNHKGRMDTRKKTSIRNATPVLDLNQKERLHANDTALRDAFVAFDLNQDSSSSGKEASLPSRAPIFDLNEISTGDEDFHSNVEAVNYEEARRSLMRHPNDEVQNDLMLSMCRNAGEGPSRVGKRKISWQDPVALRV